LEERITSYAQLARYDQVGSGFTIAKAAFALAGFLPRFHAGGAVSLAQQLRAFGGGIEVSLLCAVPKGSGLGTSSILAATLLGTLSNLCGLNWNEQELTQRTLALEQMLTAGGGWQDQVGGLLRGLKLIETEPGLLQKPAVRWLPDQLFGPAHANKTALLYYTGLTRVAKGILQEIVRGMFLNSRDHLATLARIGENAHETADALSRADWNALAGAVANSWRLNQQLDRGTNPPAVQSILAAIAPHVAGAKLLGAGGGGYLLILARDEGAAVAIRRILAGHPPNARARFVDLSLSETGFQVTRS
jgi:galactokinase/mevalonate kinase-like predicted kinase